MLHELVSALEETLFMVFTAGLLTWFIGLPIGAILSATGPGKFLENPFVHKPFLFLIKTTRRIPYIVLMIAMIPVTRFITGSGEGCVAAIIPLTIASIPFFAELSEKAINKISSGLIEAAKAVGASRIQIIYKVLIPEALPEIIRGLTATLTHLVAYSTIAGALGGGGLGSLMIHKGYYSFHSEYVIAIVILLIGLSKAIQSCGEYIVNGTLNHDSKI